MKLPSLLFVSSHTLLSTPSSPYSLPISPFFTLLFTLPFYYNFVAIFFSLVSFLILHLLLVCSLLPSTVASQPSFPTASSFSFVNYSCVYLFLLLHLSGLFFLLPHLFPPSCSLLSCSLFPSAIPSLPYFPPYSPFSCSITYPSLHSSLLL